MDPRELLQKYVSGTISPSEKEVFGKWLDSLSDEQYQDLLLEHETLMTSVTVQRQEDPVWLEKIFQGIAGQEDVLLRPVKSIRVTPGYWRWAAAAAILLVLGTGTWFAFFLQKAGSGKEIGIAAVAGDVSAPSGARTILTLADGTKIVMDSAQEGTVASQGSTHIIKSAGGQVTYSGGSGKTSDIQLNTLSTAKGGKTMVVLADGTRVWLNALSSLKYPVAFTGPERPVAVTGEAYFEVHPDKMRPFIVTINGTTEVEVLGTQFNVNGYSDEPGIHTSLFEGSVRVKGYNGSTPGRRAYSQGMVLKPGEQAATRNAAGDGQFPISVGRLSEEEMDAVKAWKDGRFQFNSANIYTVFRQAARWYDLDVSYQDSIPDSFSGEIPRNMPLSELLKVLSATDKVKFEIHEHHITVRRK